MLLEFRLLQIKNEVSKILKVSLEFHIIKYKDWHQASIWYQHYLLYKRKICPGYLH